jgi:hypothetical protein
VAGISVSSAAQYMSDQRMQTLSRDVVETARRISQDLGCGHNGGPGLAAVERQRTPQRRRSATKANLR